MEDVPVIIYDGEKEYSFNKKEIEELLDKVRMLGRDVVDMFQSIASQIKEMYYTIEDRVNNLKLSELNEYNKLKMKYKLGLISDVQFRYQKKCLNRKILYETRLKQGRVKHKRKGGR